MKLTKQLFFYNLNTLKQFCLNHTLLSIDDYKHNTYYLHHGWLFLDSHLKMLRSPK